MVQDKRLYDGGIPDISYHKCHKFLQNNSLVFNEAIERKCNVNIHWSGLCCWVYIVHVIHFHDNTLCHTNAKTNNEKKIHVKSLVTI